MTRVAAALILLAFLLPASLWAQSQEYTLALREVPLEEALSRFVEATGVAVSYDPAVVRGRRASCAAEAAGAESILQCILRDSGLDFYRLSSGTYVVTERVRLAPERGFVAGRVVDDETGGPVADSHVQLADAGLSTVTDHSGRFTFPALLPGRYVLTVSHVGYRTWRDTLALAPSEQLQTEAALRSEPILITPVIVDGLQQRRPSTALGRPVLAGSDSRLDHATPPPTLRRVRSLAGVRLNDVTADVHIQGADAGAQQFRLDGVPVFLPRSMAGLVGPFSMFAVDQITVHKAGFGAEHGSRLGGIVSARHALAEVNDFELHGDPYSINARLRLSPGEAAQNRVSAMVAARVGLWDLMAPPRLQSTLESWSRPDPFLLSALLPESESSAATPDLSELMDAKANPAVRLSDVHGAVRVRFGPLRSLHASAYDGRQALDGGVLARSPRANFQSDQPPFTVADAYAWRNSLGQVRYEAVLGSRSLASLQLRASSYRLAHEYRMLDSLGVVRQGETTRLTSLSTTSAKDGNAIFSLALEGSVDHAYGPHHLQVGLESGIINSRFDLRSVRFRGDSRGSGSDYGVIGEEARDAFGYGSVSSTADSWYAASYFEDRLRLTDDLHIEAGVRLTYLGARRTVYAEPRLALLVDRAASVLGAWSSRTSAGLYRQFLSQVDASTLNVGALLPSVRVWLPVDATVRPPMAYHLAQELLFTLHPRWSIRLEGFAKFEQHGLALAYAPANQGHLTGPAEQSQLLTPTRGLTKGGSLSADYETGSFRTEARYAFESATRRGEHLFGGRRHPTPWSEPHRLELAADWVPSARFAFSGRWRSVWGRTWGFRQVYYDYFGQSDNTRFHEPFDLGDPAAHELPPLHQLDLSAAYTQPLGSARLQVRAEIINVLNRANVIDWRLIREGEEWRKEARKLYPMMPAVGLRLSL